MMHPLIATYVSQATVMPALPTTIARSVLLAHSEAAWQRLLAPFVPRAAIKMLLANLRALAVPLATQQQLAFQPLTMTLLRIAMCARRALTIPLMAPATALGMQVVPCARQASTKPLFSKLHALRATSATPPAATLSPITISQRIATRAH
jgi:hypothetical protein